MIGMVVEAVGGAASVGEAAVVSVEEMVDGAAGLVDETEEEMVEETVNLADENQEEGEMTRLDRVDAKNQVGRASLVVNRAMPSMR